MYINLSFINRPIDSAHCHNFKLDRFSKFKESVSFHNESLSSATIKTPIPSDVMLTTTLLMSVPTGRESTL